MLHQRLRMLLGHAPHVDDDIAVQSRRELHAIGMDVARVGAAAAAMHDDDLVLREQPNDVRPDEMSPADDDDSHFVMKSSHAPRSIDPAAVRRMRSVAEY